MKNLTLQEAFDKARKICESKRPTIFNRDADISKVDFGGVTELSIFHDYEGDMPDLGLFPNLTSFHSTKRLSLEYIQKQDLSRISSLYLTFDKSCGSFKISAPQLEELTIYIDNNTDSQCSLFDVDAVNIIDISNLPKLRKIMLMHTTGYEIITGETNKSVTQLIVTDRHDDFEFVKCFQNLEQLTVTGSRCSDISFINSIKSVVDLDLSYNEITDISALVITDKLKRINLYRNPVKNIHVLNSFSGTLIFTEKDHAIKSFESTMWRLSNMAYNYVKRCRQEDTKRSSYLQHLYDKKTDYELYKDYLISELKREKDKYADNKSILNVEDIEEFVKKEYPFLADRR